VEEVLSGVLFTKRSDADDEALNVDGQVYPVRDPDGNITGYKVFGRAELTISEKLRVAAQVSPTQEGGTDASLRATLGDNIELAKGKRSGQDDIDYEQIIARIPGGSLSYQQGHGDQDFEGKELRGQYSLPIGGATASVHGGVSEEEKNIVPEQIQRLFQNLMLEQRRRNLGASVRGRIGKGVGSLNVNRMWGDTASPQSRFQDTRPTYDAPHVTSVGAQYQMPIGRGEAVLSGGASRKRGDELDWTVGAQFRYPFPR
jgi:hypothetical protein